MTIQRERWLLDTNVWIFGLRREDGFPACARLLDRIGSCSILIPLQVLKELNLTLAPDELREFYQFINRYPEYIELNWEPTPLERVSFYDNGAAEKATPSSRLMLKQWT